MRIEETFRHIKWARGIADVGALKMRKERNVETLLTVMMVGHYILYLSGLAAQERGVGGDYISNGRKERMSLVSIERRHILEGGCKVLAGLMLDSAGDSAP